MSLVGTLGKLAMGVMVAKGVGKMMGGGAGGAGGGLGGLLGGALGKAGGAGGLGGLLGGAQGGQAGGQTGGQSGGGLGDLGSLLGGGKTAGGAQLPGGMAGGLGGLLESISGGNAGGAAQAGGAAAPAAPGGSMGDLLNAALKGEKAPEPEPAQEAQAKILIQAMINAAKADGKIDTEEQNKIVEHLGNDISDADRQFVIGEMQKPLDVDGFLKSIPPGTEAQVYMMSLMGIDLDTKEEAVYLDSIRKAMNISEQQANALHTQLGAPTLYS